MCRAIAGVFSLAPFRTKRCHEAVDHLAAKLLGMKVMTLLGYNGAAADEFDFGSGASLPLSLKTRAVDVTIVQCSGRIVAGPEAESLREHVCGTLQDHRDIILHLGEVAFIDSSGLGMLVRL